MHNKEHKTTTSNNNSIHFSTIAFSWWADSHPVVGKQDDQL